jgi:FkbM family methyltransferase
MNPLSLVAERVPPHIFVRIVALQYWLMEPELRQLDAFVPRGKDAVDVGTWWGPWSVWLARRVPQVHAFEPNKTIFESLCNALPGNVDLQNLALSDHKSHATLWSPVGGRGTEGRSSLLSHDHEGWAEQTITTVALDEFGFNNVGFVKIDVEGHELAVLRGSSDLIERERPNVLVEVEEAHQSGGDAEGVFSYFAERGYSGSFFAEKRWRPLVEFDREEARRVGERVKSMGMLHATVMRSGERYTHNFLFRPEHPRD